MVLPLSPEVVRSGSIILCPGWRGCGSKYCVEASRPVYCDSGGISHLLPRIGVWNSAVYFSCDKFSKSSDERSFGAFPFQVVPCIVGHTDEISDVLVDIVVLHVHFFDLGAGSFRFLSVSVFGSELFQKLIPGVLVIGGGWVISPYPHAILPVTDFFSRDE